MCVCVCVCVYVCMYKCLVQVNLLSDTTRILLYDIICNTCLNIYVISFYKKFLSEDLSIYKTFSAVCMRFELELN